MKRAMRHRTGRRSARAAAVTVFVASTTPSFVHGLDFAVKSGIGIWVDPETPADRQSYVSSRGDTWELVMSDEFNKPKRSFKAGEDHMWTSIDKPDGVNAALQVYSHNMTTTKCDPDGTCYFQITAMEETTNLRVWNDYQKTPGFKTVSFYYRSGMVQTWNKFCYQGGMLEVRAQLPGALNPDSGNPDIQKGPNGLAEAKEYYPTWPGVWMLGNLGRAIFSASNNRMWPFSYDECDPDVFEPTNQRISACNANPGHGLNPNQGRGAPEIDLIEGAGFEISTSIQVGPGMPPKYRMFFPDTDKEPASCVFYGTCKTPGANQPDVPTNLYMSQRGHKSWYQGLRYAANNFCSSDPKKRQSYETVKAALTKGITENACGINTCSAAKDPNADLGFIDGKGPDRWGINSNGTCFPLLNGYSGAYLCSPGNKGELCDQSDPIPVNPKVTPFAYQMDAISANWPIHVGAYTGYAVYQVEWVMGRDGYVRWMLDGNPLYEIPSSSVENVPQDSKKSNPRKIMIEEPLYVILNVALSSRWGTQPPNPGKPCRGDGSDPKVNKICDGFPMYFKLDYIRVYQDRSNGSKMAVGCDPPSHPTRQWILDHIDEYQTWDNPAIDVRGRAFCRDDDDCTVGNSTLSKVLTGRCVKNRCECNGATWTGPRCTSTVGSLQVEAGDGGSFRGMFQGSYGPPWSVALSVAALSVLLTIVTIYYSLRQTQQNEAEHKRQVQLQPKSALSISSASEVGWKPNGNTNYATNFV